MSPGLTDTRGAALQQLFTFRGQPQIGDISLYAPHPDGERFLVNAQPEPTLHEIHVTPRWRPEAPKLGRDPCQRPVILSNRSGWRVLCTVSFFEASSISRRAAASAPMLSYVRSRFAVVRFGNDPKERKDKPCLSKT